MEIKNIWLTLKEPIISADLQLEQNFASLEMEPEVLASLLAFTNAGKNTSLIITNPFIKSNYKKTTASSFFQLTKKTLVIFITGLRDVDLPLFDQNNFPHCYLHKPFTKTQLLKAIQNLAHPPVSTFSLT